VNVQIKHLLAAALLGLALLASIGSAGAESIATGCLDQATGEVYGLRMYSNNTLAECEAGDEMVRFAVQQPDTEFKKDRVTLPFGAFETRASWSEEIGDVSVEVVFEGFRVGDGAPSTACELLLFYDEFYYLLASAEPGTEVDGLTSVVRFHRDARSQGVTKATTGAILSIGQNWAVLVHDLRVANRGNECFVAYMIEFADDPDKLYSR
jgi:hypothetical protein